MADGYWFGAWETQISTETKRHKKTSGCTKFKTLEDVKRNYQIPFRWNAGVTPSRKPLCPLEWGVSTFFLRRLFYKSVEIEDTVSKTDNNVNVACPYTNSLSKEEKISLPFCGKIQNPPICKFMSAFLIYKNRVLWILLWSNCKTLLVSH